jgi:hypothetical protein
MMTGQFNHSNSFKKAFEGNCIKLLVSAYHEAVMAKSINLNWEENDITAQLHEYIDCNPFRLEKHIVADVEHHLKDNSSTKNKGFAAKYSRIDMKFVVFRRRLEYKYFAEAKLLKEHDSGLKRRYIDTGIDNFTSGRYYNGCLIAYIIEGILINTVEGINKLLEKDQRNSEILIKSTCKYYDGYFASEHSSIGTLKHYMFDFTNSGASHDNR